MDKLAKIKQLEKALKIKVDNEEKISADFDSIIEMFDKIKQVDVDNYSSTLERKKIHINELRKDEPIDSTFRDDLKGKYIEVPAVSKKDN